MKDKLQLFENSSIRSAWDEEKMAWYFSVLDIVAVLTDQPDYVKVRNYWKWLKSKLNEEGSQLVSNTNQLKLIAPDGKKRLTDVMDEMQILRLIESIPSKKAEPFKLWLAQVGKERLDEMTDPEIAMERAIIYYRHQGYDEEWIKLRIQSIITRKDLTYEWQKSGISSSKEFAILTNLMTKTWSGKSVAEYKKHKNLKKESLRDNMTNLELVLNMLAEASASEISKNEQPDNFEGSKNIALKGAGVAKAAADNLRIRGVEPVSSKNAIANGHEKLSEGKNV
jgi:hypothetical protein